MKCIDCHDSGFLICDFCAGTGWECDYERIECSYCAGSGFSDDECVKCSPQWTDKNDWESENKEDGYGKG